MIVDQRARRRLVGLAIWPAFDLALCAAGLILGTAYLIDHWPDWRLVAPASAVLFSLIALLADSVLQLKRVAQLDWRGPAVTIRHALESIRIARIRQFNWIILSSPRVGFCGFVLGIHWFFGWLSDDRVNILDQLDPRWVAANYAFGMLFVPLGWLALRQFTSRDCKERNRDGYSSSDLSNGM